MYICEDLLLDIQVCILLSYVRTFGEPTCQEYAFAKMRVVIRFGNCLESYPDVYINFPRFWRINQAE